MNLILSPKLFAIDTSILGKVAKDYYSQDQSKIKKALKFMSTITEKGLIPLFCMHHFQEILQHDNDYIVSNRLSLIKKFTQVAWIKPSDPQGLIGSIIDIQGTEISVLLDNPGIVSTELISKVRKKLIAYSSGNTFIDNIQKKLLKLRELNLFGTQKSKAVSSLSHVTDPKIENIKLSTLHHSVLKKPLEIEQSIKLLRETLNQELANRGDKKLVKHDEVIAEFIQLIVRDGLKMYESNSDLLFNKFVESLGIDPTEINEDLTISELGQYATFKKKIQIIARSYNFDIEKALKIPPETIPSWFIWTEIDNKTREEKFASGSNIIDKYLAALAFYSDFLIVDKRIKEYFRQITQKNAIYSFINSHVVKLSSYDMLEKQFNTIS
ncbi:MAG: hypothetical protein WC124_07210 [Desulfoplanes sp.]